MRSPHSIPARADYGGILVYWSIRLGILTVAQLHIFAHCQGDTLGTKLGTKNGASWRSAAFARHCAVYVCLSLLLGAGLYTVVVVIFDGRLGFTTMGILRVPQALRCAMQTGDNLTQCPYLHLDDSIYRWIADEYEYLLPRAWLYRMAWGGSFPQQTQDIFAAEGRHVGGGSGWW